MYHNHKENIKAASLWIDSLRTKSILQIDVIYPGSGAAKALAGLIESFIKDAESGHKRIKELVEEQLKLKEGEHNGLP